jgi:hypothetical protein
MPGLLRLCERRLAPSSRTVRPVPAALALPSVQPNQPAGANLPFVFALEGETWNVSYQGESFRLRDSLGLRYLARLFEQPNRGIGALELSGVTPSDVKLADQSDAGELLDERARASYQARRRELSRELEEAEAFSDLGRATRAREELEFLSAELARAVGLGGRARRAGGAAERARSAVQRRIKNAFDRIREHSPALAELLEQTVKTGSECIFLPERVPSR